MYRVIEVARLLGVSKVTIYKKMEQLKKELKPYVKHRSNIAYLEEGAVEILKESLNGVNSKLTHLGLNDSGERSLLDKDSGAQLYFNRYNQMYELYCTDMLHAIESLDRQIQLKKEEVERKTIQLEILKKLSKTVRTMV